MCRNVSPFEAKKLINQGDVIILDVRTPQEYNTGYIPGAKLVPLQYLPYIAGQLNKNQKILVYCRSGSRSMQACIYLSKLGFTNVYNMQGGIIAWKNAGLKLEGGYPVFARRII